MPGRTDATATGVDGVLYGDASWVSTTPVTARTPVDALNAKSCSTRACGSHSHRFPAPVSGEIPTCARDEGSRGLKIGLSIPTMTLRVFQLRLMEPVRRRKVELKLTPPVKKSM